MDTPPGVGGVQAKISGIKGFLENFSGIKRNQDGPPQAENFEYIRSKMHVFITKIDFALCQNAIFRSPRNVQTSFRNVS